MDQLPLSTLRMNIDYPGILPLTSEAHGAYTKQVIRIALENLYNLIGEIRESARAFEDDINGLLYGPEVEERSHYRSLRQRLLDHRG